MNSKYIPTKDCAGKTIERIFFGTDSGDGFVIIFFTDKTFACILSEFQYEYMNIEECPIDIKEDCSYPYDSLVRISKDSGLISIEEFNNIQKKYDEESKKMREKFEKEECLKLKKKFEPIENGGN